MKDWLLENIRIIKENIENFPKMRIEKPLKFFLILGYEELKNKRDKRVKI